MIGNIYQNLEEDLKQANDCIICQCHFGILKKKQDCYTCENIVCKNCVVNIILGI